jgi:hypothetical protein
MNILYFLFLLAVVLSIRASSSSPNGSISILCLYYISTYLIISSSSSSFINFGGLLLSIESYSYWHSSRMSFISRYCSKFKGFYSSIYSIICAIFLPFIRDFYVSTILFLWRFKFLLYSFSSSINWGLWEIFCILFGKCTIWLLLLNKLFFY